jgi:hypothetical protein
MSTVARLQWAILSADQLQELLSIPLASFEGVAVESVSLQPVLALV